ncbi:MAG: hypothetical protein C4289_02455 [Chloroflexota bacterium]
MNTASLPRYLHNPYIQAGAGIYRRVKDQLLAGRMLTLVLELDLAVEREIGGWADLTTSAAVAWLASSPPQPLLLWVHYFDPHYSSTPPPVRPAVRRYVFRGIRWLYADNLYAIRLSGISRRVRAISSTGKRSMRAR